MLLTIKELLHHPGGMSLTIKGLLQSLMIKELHYQRRPGDVPRNKRTLVCLTAERLLLNADAKRITHDKRCLAPQSR
jgi:hypothetical protein